MQTNKDSSSWVSKDIHLLLEKLCNNCPLNKYGERNLAERELNHDTCQLHLECIIILYMSKMSSVLNVLQKIICVMLMIKFLFLL